jgi:hypothetical protein
MQTRWTRVSQNKIAAQGDTYTDQWIGVQAVFTTYGGDRLVGTITGFADHFYPVVTFPDGRWARLGTAVEVVDA